MNDQVNQQIALNENAGEENRVWNRWDWRKKVASYMARAGLVMFMMIGTSKFNTAKADSPQPDKQKTTLTDSTATRSDNSTEAKNGATSPGTTGGNQPTPLSTSTDSTSKASFGEAFKKAHEATWASYDEKTGKVGSSVFEYEGKSYLTITESEMNTVLKVFKDKLPKGYKPTDKKTLPQKVGQLLRTLLGKDTYTNEEVKNFLNTTIETENEERFTIAEIIHYVDKESPVEVKPTQKVLDDYGKKKPVEKKPVEKKSVEKKVVEKKADSKVASTNDTKTTDNAGETIPSKSPGFVTFEDWEKKYGFGTGDASVNYSSILRDINQVKINGGASNTVPKDSNNVSKQGENIFIQPEGEEFVSKIGSFSKSDKENFGLKIRASSCQENSVRMAKSYIKLQQAMGYLTLSDLMLVLRKSKK